MTSLPICLLLLAAVTQPFLSPGVLLHHPGRSFKRRIRHHHHHQRHQHRHRTLMTKLECSSTNDSDNQREESAEPTESAAAAADDDDMTWDPTVAPKLDFNEDYYSVLEVDPLSSLKDLKTAYKTVVYKYHPDRKTTEKEKKLANKQMMVINGAFRVLKAPETRRQYDRARMAGLVGANSGVRGSGKPTGGTTTSPSTTTTTTTGAYRKVEDPWTYFRRRTTAAAAASEYDEQELRKQRRKKLYDDMKIDIDMDDVLKGTTTTRTKDPETTYYQRKDHYDWEDFARADVEDPRTKYSSVSDDADETQEQKDQWEMQESRKKKAKGTRKAVLSSKERVDGGFIFITEKDGEDEDDDEAEDDDDIVNREKKKDTSNGSKEVERIVKESVEGFFNDAYDQLEKTPVKGAMGELSMALRVLLGLVVNRDEDEKPS